MRALAQKKWSRPLCLILCVFFAALGALCWGGGRECWVRGWYAASPYADNDRVFEETGFARMYVDNCLYYIQSFIQWQGTIGEDVVSGYSGEAFSVRITDGDTGEVILDTTDESSRKVDTDYYVYFTEGGTAALDDPDGPYSDEDFIPVEHLWLLEGYVNLPPTPYSGCYAEYMVYSMLVLLRPWFIPAAVVSLLLAAALAALLIWLAALYTPEKKLFLDRLPAELPVLGALLAASAVRGLAGALLTRLNNYTGYMWPLYEAIRAFVWPPVLAASWTAAALLGIWSLVRRYRRGELRQSSLLARVPAGWRQFALVLLAALISILWAYTWWGGYLNEWQWVAVALLVLAAVYSGVAAAQQDRLGRAARELAAGRLEYKIRTEGLVSGLREQGEALNRIGEGMKLAVEEKIKDERFKTELITNVSHDLKTPLTSIVSYVDLLKKENVASETAREYIDVIERQSAKLKKLTEDLVEASKASAGAIAVHPEPTDVRELLSQSVGEYEERLAASGVEAVLSLPEHGVVLDTDGRLLWRVLENLIQNIVKYAQPGTRAYFDLSCGGGRVSIALKNISAQELNIPAEALMERFVRGDSSRSTEGSGLGLSIAQSLTELLGGTMTLYLDGDLFKVTLAFEGARAE